MPQPQSRRQTRRRAGTHDIFGDPIDVYTRAQAIEDGVLVDAGAGDLAEVSRQHYKLARGHDGGRRVFRVACTKTARPAWRS